MLSKTNDLIISLFPWFIFLASMEIIVSNQNVSMRYVLFLLMSDFILIKGNKMKPSSYVYLARIAYMHSMHEKKVYKGK